MQLCCNFPGFHSLFWHSLPFSSGSLQRPVYGQAPAHQPLGVFQRDAQRAQVEGGQDQHYRPQAGRSQFRGYGSLAGVVLQSVRGVRDCELFFLKL